MRFSFKVGLRYFQSGGSQTALTIASVAFGVTVYLFISSLIFGLQSGLIRTTIGSSSQITIEPLEEAARVLPLQGQRSLSTVQPFNERIGTIRAYLTLLPELDKISGVTAVSPVASGSGVAIRGGQSRPITILGIDENRGAQVYDFRTAMASGRFDLAGQGCAVGIELARLLGLKVGDKLRVESARGVDQIFSITGIFDAGNKGANERSLYVSLPNGQRLNDMIGAVSRIEMKVADPLVVEPATEVVRNTTQLQVQNWKEGNADLLAGLAAQSQTTGIIRIFVMILVATSVASVLIVSVLQRSREIGILKSLGASTRDLQNIFIVLGALVGATGALVGVGCGGLLILGLAQIPGDSGIRPGYALPIDLQPTLVIEAFLVAFVIGSVAAILPARRAALMNPVDVIRQG
ncbi:MAG: FtsX-like permease family protein [Fimbriimonadaceae bacterium]